MAVYMRLGVHGTCHSFSWRNLSHLKRNERYFVQLGFFPVNIFPTKPDLEMNKNDVGA